jgi:integrase
VHVRFQAQAVLVAIGTGMRRGDQLSLRWEKVDFQRNVIYVANQKTGREYPVPMNEDVRGAMLSLKREARAGAEFVFVNPKTGGRYLDVKKAFARACAKAGIGDFRWHDLRHTFGTRLAEAGYSEATIAELMGHADRKTTGRYTHGTDRAKREAVEAARTRAGKAYPNYAPNEKRPAVKLAVSR